MGSEMCIRDRFTMDLRIRQLQERVADGDVELFWKATAQQLMDRVRREPPSVGSEEGVLGASVSWRPAAELPAGTDEHKSLACCSVATGCGCRAGEPAPVPPLLLTARAGPPTTPPGC